MRGQVPGDSPMEAGVACENLSPLGFLVECLSRQTCLPDPVLIWVGKGRTWEAGRERGCLWSSLCYFLLNLQRIREFFKVNTETSSWPRAILLDYLSVRAWILVMGAKSGWESLSWGSGQIYIRDALWWGGPIGPLGEFPQQPALAWEVIMAGHIGRYLPFPSYHFLAGTVQRGRRDWGECGFQTSLFTGQVTALPGVRVGAGLKPQMNLRTKIQLSLEFE